MLAFKASIFAGHPALANALFAWNAAATGLKQATIVPKNKSLPDDFKDSAPAYLLETEAGIWVLCRKMLIDGVDRDQAIAILDVAMTALANEMGPDAKAEVSRYIVDLHFEVAAAGIA